MLKRYYVKEIIMIALFSWIVAATSQVNAATSDLTDKVEDLQTDINNLYALLNEMHEMVYNLKHKVEVTTSLTDELTFHEAFQVMRHKYGPHHLFEWRGRIFTTDTNEERKQ